MKLTLQNTTQFAEVDGVPCRVWEGTTESGVAVMALICRVAVAFGADCGEFERELEETRPPSVAALEVFPLRMIL